MPVDAWYVMPAAAAHTSVYMQFKLARLSSLRPQHVQVNCIMPVDAWYVLPAAEEKAHAQAPAMWHPYAMLACHHHMQAAVV
jgi:hypothetical protein